MTATGREEAGTGVTREAAQNAVDFLKSSLATSLRMTDLAKNGRRVATR